MGDQPADARERAARQRVEEIFKGIDRLDRESLWTPLSHRDLEDRTFRLAGLERAVDQAGLGPLLDESRRWLREALDHRLAARGRQPESGVWGVSEVGRAEDIAAVRLALEDVIAVAIAVDLIPWDDAVVLTEPGFAVLGMPPLGTASMAPSAILGSTADSEPATLPDRPAWEPSPDDWAASEDGGASPVRWRWWTAPSEASQESLLAVLLITLIGAVAGGAVLGLPGVLVFGTLAGGVGWLLVGIPRRRDDEEEDQPPGP